MIVDCISDLHGAKPKLEGGDLLIVAGDLTASDSSEQLDDFYSWLYAQSYKKKIVIAGNHDNYFYACHSRVNPSVVPFSLKNTEYLCDSGTEFAYYPPLPKDAPDGTIFKRPKFKIWGSPWTTKFEGMNPHCMAFTVDTDRELADKWSLIPEDVDILVTHSPPYGILDEAMRTHNYQSVGSKSLTAWLKGLDVLGRKKPLVHVFGHIHEGHGSTFHNMTHFINASIMDVNYRPSNKPIRITL